MLLPCGSSKRIECFIDHNAYSMLYGPCFKFYKALYSTKQFHHAVQSKIRHYSFVCRRFRPLGSSWCDSLHQDSLADNIDDIGKHGTLCDDHSSKQLVQYKTNECPLLKMTLLWSCWCFFVQNKGSVVKPHKTVALPFVVMAMLQCDVFSNSCCTHTYVYVIITVLLAFDTHVLQGYSSWLCLCVSFNFSIQ